ncbi:MAG: sigma-70 family RNA polymerase sigma factor [Gemmatimonadetes bacterium]|nr:sigma-70 family RNA polymerase sigma factor [Gemmatimonadota bacterium]
MTVGDAQAQTEDLDRREEYSAIVRIRSGDAEALGVLVRRHTGPALSLAYRLLENRQDAEDVVQEAFMAVLINIDSFDLGRPFGPWFRTIVANKAHNVVKSKARRGAEPLTGSIPAGGASPDRAAERSDTAARVTRALEQLPEDQRTMIRLFELEGFTSGEIAESLGIAPGTVRWHLHQARSKLRSILDPKDTGKTTEVADG